MGALEPPHTPRLAGSALHYRALAPVEHSGHDKPTGEEYKAGVAGVKGAEPARVGLEGSRFNACLKTELQFALWVCFGRDG